MKQHGQIFSLDLLISMVLVVAALGITMQFLELKELEAKELTEQMELERVGNTAVELLLSSPGIVCELTDDTKTQSFGFLQNCVPKINAMGHRLTKAQMGIPDGYKCKIDKDSPSSDFQTADCEKGSLPDDIKNIYSAKRKIVFYKGTGSPAEKKMIKKSELEICMACPLPPATCPACNRLESEEITLWVWKA